MSALQAAGLPFGIVWIDTEASTGSYFVCGRRWLFIFQKLKLVEQPNSKGRRADFECRAPFLLIEMINDEDHCVIWLTK